MVEKNLRAGFVFFCCIVGIAANVSFMYPQFWQWFMGAIIILCILGVSVMVWQIARGTR
jgi:hypothetical protein